MIAEETAEIEMAHPAIIVTKKTNKETKTLIIKYVGIDMGGRKIWTDCTIP